ncbi:MAG: hypothetical protein BGO98_30080 [Myxococcales bacterium 68-20]|nr:hypothetical protein [Myxococcales bacterium]OJY16335.1 MAG: hypothetical protein BGO98_30080 [Myxococcales bacterium 68-20]
MESPKSKDPQKELEIALAELEERVDRLRASYEQYFMGYEKIEPGVQRKDVDRRFTVLRKQQIRNTALRFRFNVITQKFNTYSMYWTRICRQIEEGTYKRHIAKAAKRFGNATPNKREQDWSIEVELGDFEEVDDMASILAEADAAAEAYGRGGLDADTIPPGALSEPPVAEPIARPAPLPVKRSLMTVPTPGTSFAMSGGRETVGSEPPSSEATPAPLRESAPRVVRHAPLPPGARQPVLVRRRADDVPPSSPEVGRGDRRSSPLPIGEHHATRQPPASRPDVRPAAPSSDRMPPSSSPIHTPAPSSAGRPAPGSVRVPGAPPSSEGAPPSVRRIAAGAAAPSTGRIPTAAQPQSTGRLPVAARSSAGNITTPASPMTPPRVAQPAPYRPAALPPSANRLPVAQTPPAAPRMATTPTVRPPTPTAAGRLPVPPGSTPQGPSPSGVDSEQPQPGRRPPPPLPGQPNKKP